ncbi:MAG TPA: esterase-like activity of phytase family protein [Novosphingobium sp.]|nr:esterase-like activity of phytase family protein [Novosphingobium sp.]
MRRALALLPLIAAVVLTTWMRSPRPPAGLQSGFRFIELRGPSRAEQAPHLGPFVLERVWAGRTAAYWGHGFSNLVALPDDELLAFSDRGHWIRFPAPDPAPDKEGGLSAHAQVYPPGTVPDTFTDIESATRDPFTGRIWLGHESSNIVVRLDRRLQRERVARPPAMAGWSHNSGAEAMVRMADGRFLILREVDAASWDSSPSGLLFAGEPGSGREPDSRAGVTKFRVEGPAYFRPTDAAQLPDGRVLVLYRRLVWPFPLRFAGRLAIGDPKDIRAGRPWRLREVARLTSTLPVDNFEGMAVVPRSDGHLTVWLLSDDNNAKTQRTILWKLGVDPAKLR